MKILYTKNASENILLELLSVLSASDDITLTYTEYMRFDDHYAVMTLTEFNKKLLVEVLDRDYKNAGICQIDKDSDAASLTQVLDLENRKLFKELLGGDFPDVHYSDSGVVLSNGAILITDDVCYSNLVNKNLGSAQSVNKLVAAFYAVHTRDILY